MNLTQVRGVLGLPHLVGDDLPLRGVAYDSRRLQPGDVFVAIPGFHVDGHDYLEQAIAKGAGAVVVRQEYAERLGENPAVPVLAVADTRHALSALSALVAGYPARSLRVIGVTGTDGKTTTTYLISALLEAAGHTTGLMGTVDFKIGPEWRRNDTRQTTPEALEVQALLAEMRDAGVTHAVVESSSHGLELRKLDHCAYDTAAVTYVGEDHLDLHGTREAYLAAKGRLFELLGERGTKPGPATAVLNADDSSYAPLRARTRVPVLSYGVEQAADLRAEGVASNADGSSFRLVTPAGTRPLRLRLPGRFNISNALAAAAAALAEGVTLDRIVAGLEGVTGVPGRMERIDQGQPFTVVVDYAHTGPAFEKVLRTLRPLTSGRLIVVFGCAGGRAQERRAGMGSVAAAGADFAVLTNEDPYDEDPLAILSEIAAVMTAAGRQQGQDFIQIPERREAVREALRRARPGDLVLLAGKGHEQSIVVQGAKQPWDERQVAREELAELGWSGG